jgi:hypothetical protein
VKKLIKNEKIPKNINLKNSILDIEVVAQQKFPRSIFGKCYALCAYFRICLAAFFICYKHRDADVIFCDQASSFSFKISKLTIRY